MTFINFDKTDRFILTGVSHLFRKIGWPDGGFCPFLDHLIKNGSPGRGYLPLPDSC